jgi:hypothetical protein
MKFGFTYDSADCHMSAQNVRQALPENRRIDFDLGIFRPDVDINGLLQTAAAQGTIPDVIVHETIAPGLPRGFNTVSIPTACLDIDTFGWTDFRLQWGMLFDYVFTWHPSYVRPFQELGHPRVFALPHAIDARLFEGHRAEPDRLYEVGFVGSFGSPQYHRRDRVLSRLASRFRTNDFRRKYNNEEMVGIYRRSKLVVNVSRTEFPPEANMRCFEAMAGGALLITGVPSELTEWGLREGDHFVGWRNEAEIPDLVAYYLMHDSKREKIARAAQERTLKEFTYQRCVETIESVIYENKGQFFAPARRWPAEEVHLLYLSYYYRLQLLCAALEEFQLLRKAAPGSYWKGVPMVAKTLRNVLRRTLF